MAAQEPSHSQHRPTRRAARGKCLQRIARTRWMKTTVAPKQRTHIAPIRAKHRHRKVSDRPPRGAFNRQVARLCASRAAFATRGRAGPRPPPQPGATPPHAPRCPTAATLGSSGTTRGSPASRGCGPRPVATPSCRRRGRAERPFPHLAAPPAKAVARTHARSAGQTPRRTRAGAGAAGRARSGDDVDSQGAWAGGRRRGAPTRGCGGERRVATRPVACAPWRVGLSAPCVHSEWPFALESHDTASA